MRRPLHETERALRPMGSDAKGFLRRLRRSHLGVTVPASMWDWNAVALGIVSVLFAAPSCSTCCSETGATYALSGARPANASSCSAIVANFYESESNHCGNGCTGMIDGIPGGIVMVQSLGSAPTWSANVAVSYAGDQPPGVDVYAYCDANGNGRVDKDEVCVGSTSLSPGSHDGVQLDGNCPGRI